MASHLSVSGNFAQKFRVWGVTISQNKGAYAFAVPIPDGVAALDYTRAAGPFLLKVKRDGSDIVLSASVYGILSRELGRVRRVDKPKSFSAELDKANHIEGVLALVDEPPVMDGATIRTPTA